MNVGVRLGSPQLCAPSANDGGDERTCQTSPAEFASIVIEASEYELSCRSRIGGRMLELNLKLTAAQVLDECRRRGLVVGGERRVAGRSRSRRGDLRIPG